MISKLQNPFTFPRLEDEQIPPSEGITLRDYFAGQALPVIIRVCGSDTRPSGVDYGDYCAEQAYKMADAMLAERAKS